MSKYDEQKWQLAGWISFIICSMLFIVDSIRSGNMIALVASLLFLLGCVQFTVPVVYSIRDANKDMPLLYDGFVDDSERVSE